jgi:hypothetical protein
MGGWVLGQAGRRAPSMFDAPVMDPTENVGEDRNGGGAVGALRKERHA